MTARQVDAGAPGAAVFTVRVSNTSNRALVGDHLALATDNAGQPVDQSPSPKLSCGGALGTLYCKLPTMPPHSARTWQVDIPITVRFPMSRTSNIGETVSTQAFIGNAHEQLISNTARASSLIVRASQLPATGVPIVALTSGGSAVLVLGVVLRLVARKRIRPLISNVAGPPVADSASP